MAQKEKAEVTVVSEKGQVVIPQAIRKKLGIRPKTKLLVYGYEDAVIMKKLEVPDITKELEALYRRVDARIAKYGALTQDEVEAEIQQYRKEKARKPEKA
ncbi:MAG: AbrB/MazE/SpoVT family DNA-binding domain-containing protein [Candidatus Bathyarchaeota archaeon]|nr:AbrB/MazE/SpoVT family DNA-binding domain-containing protein [Candidatus Bathyarchaeota archaeon]